MIDKIKIWDGSHDKFQQQQHFSSLDGVRCFCILAVLWHHSNPPISPQILTRGFLGVDMFFVLSGFLIVTLILREKTTTGQLSLRKFYIRRTLRIFPLYYGILFCLTLFYGIFRSQSNQHFFSALQFYIIYVSNWSLIQTPGLGAVWSLATEEQFYLFWPAIEKFLQRRFIYALLGGLILINQLINFGALDGMFAQFYGLSEAPRLEILDTTFTPICLGIALAHLLHFPRTFSLIYRGSSHRQMSLVLLVILITFMNFSPTDISGLPRLLIQILMTMLLGSLVVRENHILQPLMTWKPVVRIGKISYGMYLYHLWAFSIVNLTNRLVSGYWQINFPFFLFLLGTILTVIMAEISYRFYEMPFLKLKDRFGWQRQP